MLHKGDGVVAVRDISIGVVATIRSGTKGVVMTDEGYVFRAAVLFKGQSQQWETPSASLQKLG